jgi:hypothetical protein
MTRVFIAIVAALTLYAVPGAAQTLPESNSENAEPKLTATEKSDARAFVQRFCENLAKENSVSPSWDEFFAPDFGPAFGKNMLRDVSGNQGEEGDAIRTVVFADLDAATWRRLSAGVLDMIYFFSATEKIRRNDSARQDEDEQPLMDTLSPRARAVIESHPQLAGIFDDGGEKEIEFVSTQELYDFLDALEKLQTIMREDISANQLQEPSSSPCGEDLADTLENIQLETSDEEKFGRPAGTRFITAELPTGFALALAYQDSRLRIVGVQFGD